MGGGANLPGSAGGGGGMRVLRVSSLAGLDPETAEIAEEQLLGTDFMFFVAFAGKMHQLLLFSVHILV